MNIFAGLFSHFLILLPDRKTLIGWFYIIKKSVWWNDCIMKVVCFGLFIILICKMYYIELYYWLGWTSQFVWVWKSHSKKILNVNEIENTNIAHSGTVLMTPRHKTRKWWLPEKQSMLTEHLDLKKFNISNFRIDLIWFMKYTLFSQLRL